MSDYVNEKTHPVNIRMTDAQHLALQHEARRRGIFIPGGRGYYREVPNLSGLIQLLASSLADPTMPGAVGLYDHATQVVMSRAEYDKLAALARMIEESDQVDYATGRVRGA